MTEHVSNQRTEGDLLARVTDGMEVYDRDGKKVGTVADMYEGDVADSETVAGEPSQPSNAGAPGQGSIVADVARAFSDNMPEVLRNRLRHNGFIRVRGGLLRGDRFALRENVAAVDGQRVILNVTGGELIDF